MDHKNRVVLHVDDDPMILSLVCKKLNDKGYKVVSLEDSSRVLNRLLETDCRVVLLDIDMPGINGLDLLQRIKEHDGGIQVLMLTGLVSMTTVLESMRRGAEACFFKPINDFEPLISCLDMTFTKLDRWWKTLRELNERKYIDSANIH